MASENSAIPISNPPVIDLPSSSSALPSGRDVQDDSPISISNIQIRERVGGSGVRENEIGGGECSTSSSIPNPNINNKSPFTDDNSASTSSSTNNKSKSDSKEKDSDSDGGDEKMFECNICLDVAKDAVVSYCGHLFCWQCLHQWLETRPNRQSCPVCKAAISREKVIPLYGRGGSGVDPRSKIPPRPTPTRTEQPESNRFTWGGENGGAGGFHMSFGIGAFPFGFFASAFNWGQPGGPNGVAQNFANQQQMEEQEFMSRIFLWVALVFIVWLLLA